ncbi:MAG TPA: porin [Bordetella sp.]|uniref:porin n=1 Tax=Bordetella sp. TaxID=28081 RepID=UPI002ED4DA28
MKKTLLAAALFAGFAGFAGAAQAETQVTLYGILDSGIQYTNVKASPAGGTSTNYSAVGLANGVQSGNRWGMKGTEDIGGGTSVVFQLESGFNLDQGTSNQGSRLFGRRAFLGMQNASWGMFRVGRGPTIATDMFQGAPSDPMGYAFGPLNFGTVATSVNTYRTDNEIGYMSPVFAGFQVGAGYSFNVDKANGYSSATTMGGGAGGTARTPGFDLTATYTNGPLFAGVTYGQTNVLTQGAVRQMVLDASYDFQVVRVFGAYVRGWNGLVGAGSYGATDGASVASTILTPSQNVYYQGMKQNAFMLGVSAPIGAATSVFATFQHQTLGGANKTNSVGSSYVGAGAAQNTFGVGATYSLSKRTNLYAAAGYIDGYGNISGQKETVGVVGMRHQF